MQLLDKRGASSFFIWTYGVAIGFIGDYAPYGISPLMYNMPVISNAGRPSQGRPVHVFLSGVLTPIFLLG